MKKIVMAVLVAVLSFSMAFALTACGEEEVKVTVTYDANGGQVSSQTQEINVNDYELLVPTRDGYTFKGWTLNGITLTENSIIASDVTLVATWEVNKYNVTFEVGDRGTLTGDKTRVLNAVGYELPTPTAKAGATFNGWTLNGQPFVSGTVLTSDVTLVADYNVTAYTVTYVFTNGYKLVRDDDELSNNGSYSELLNVSEFTLPTVVAQGYEFKGWTLNGNKFDNESDLSNDITLVADLQAKKFNLIYFKSQDDCISYITSKDDDLVFDKEVISYNDRIVFPTAPIATGKTFKNWSAYVDGVIENDFIESRFSYEQDIYAFANWTDDTFTIKWLAGVGANFANGKGEQIDVVKVNDKESVVMPKNNPSHTNSYAFQKWTYNNGTSDGSDDVVVTDVTNLKEIINNAAKGDVFEIYAVFDENYYVVFKVDGVVISEQKAETNKAYAIPSDDKAQAAINAFDKEGYHIVWKTNGEVYNPENILFADTPAPVVVDAELVANTVSVTFKVWCVNNPITSETEGSVENVTVTTLTTGDALPTNGVTAKGNYVFLGWTTSPYSGNESGLPTLVSNSNFVVTDVMYSTESITLYAVFYNSIIA